MVTHISVPYYMGEHLPDLEVPAPFEELRPRLPAGTPQERMAVLNAALADLVASTDRPMIYSGDCVAILGTIAGLQRRSIDPVLVFYDAHGDFNTWETTPSQFIGGMPLAMATGRGEQTIVEGAGMRVLADGDALLVDGRDLDPGERELLAASEVRQVAVEEVGEAVPPGRPLYVHVDVDIVDPGELPAINYPAPGGPSLEAVVESVAGLAAGGNVVAFSASTWNPALEGAEVAAAATHRIAAPFLR
jgi:arginase